MNNFRCPKCNFLNFAGAAACKRCKTEFAPASVNSVVNQTPENVKFEAASAPRLPLAAPANNFPAMMPQQTNYAPTAPFGAASSVPASNVNTDESKKKGMATISLILGVVGFFTAGLLGIGAVTGVILGGIALQRANKNPREYGGKGLSIAGIVLNCLSVLSIFFIGIIAAIAIPNLLAARRAANEGSAIYGMRTLMQAEADFMESSVGHRCGDLTDLLGGKLIEANLARGEKSGYKYVVAKNADGSCEMFAAPLVSTGVAKSGTRSFYASTNEWEIRAADKNSGSASKNDPLLRMMSDSNSTRRNRPSNDDD